MQQKTIFYHRQLNFWMQIFLLAGLIFATPALAQDAQKPVESPPATHPLMIPQTAKSNQKDIAATNTIEAEKENLTRLEAQLREIQTFEKNLATEINGYHLQLSAHANLLASQEADIGAIEKAWTAHQTALTKIKDQLADIAQRRGAVRQRLEGAEGQYDLNQKQLTEINAQSADPARTQAMVEKLQKLIRILGAKINLLETMDEIYKKALVSLENLQKSFVQLAPKFDETLQEKRKEALFQRKEPPILGLTPERIKSALADIRNRAAEAFTRVYWAEQFQGIQEIRVLPAIFFFLVLTLVEYLMFQARRWCDHLSTFFDLARRFPWRHFTLSLFQRSLPLAGFTLVIFTWTYFRGYYDVSPLVQVVVHILFISLCCRWGWDFLFLWNERRDKKIHVRLVRRFRALIIILGAFAIGYRLLSWLMGEFSFILSFARIGFLVATLIWGIVFWRAFRKIDHDAYRIVRITSLFRRSPLPEASEELEPTTDRICRAIKTALLSAGDVIWIGTLLMEAAGYGSLAIFWLTSWALTAVLGLWIILAYKMLHEWDKTAKADSKPLDAEPYVSVKASGSGPLRWLLRKLCWIGWGIGLVLAAVFAWGADQQVMVALYRIARHPFPIGGLDLSLMGIFNVVLVLLIIHAATRVWRAFLLYQVLADSGMETGLKHSITIITVYLIWGMGIIIALNALGVSTTSLAVAFGALSIGLGFGLQNIFSNFISGIILLFERPIQVGDTVEVNGIWGEVTKINVRSTVVKTYDNAALIIPNSDFISSQVTNWSFKDMRVRRIISVGVAYGSDIERVREILLAIPDRIPNVLKYPRPVVLFTNFGDSSLDFQLRVWTDIDNMLTVDTNIRFEINRRFRENGIQIPFPQRDVHLKSPPSGIVS